VSDKGEARGCCTWVAHRFCAHSRGVRVVVLDPLSACSGPRIPAARLSNQQTQIEPADEDCGRFNSRDGLGARSCRASLARFDA
jgi:hypothetical protein